MVLIPETLVCIFLNYKIWLFTSIILSIKLYYLLVRGVCKSPKCLVGKTVLITGANSGIGFETALDIASRGAKVIIACRDKQRGQQACDDIIARSGNPNVSLQILDLASFDSVRQCAQNVHATEDKIDILINNAGVTLMKRVTEDGLNITMQVNYCSTFLFTVLLIDLLLKGHNARIINLTSILSYFAKYKKGQLRQTENFTIFQQPYNISKMNINLFSRELNKRLKGTNVTVYSAHPGIIKTGIFRKTTIYLKFYLYVLDFFLNKNTYEGAQTTLYCALEEGIEKYSGKYFEDCKPRKYISKNYSDKMAKELWDDTIEILRLTPEELDFNVS